MSKNRRYSGAGFLDGLTEAVGNLMPGNKKENATPNAPKNNVPKNNTKNNAAKANNTAETVNVPKPETVTFGFKPSPQAGGVASVTYNVPDAQRQPSEEIMEWATTAGAPTPTTGMRNVAHGGARRTRRNRNRRNKTGGSRRNRNRSRRNRTRRNRNKSGGSRRNRNRSRRNKTGGSRRNRNRSRRNRRN
jgi:hypothetical protein